MKNKMFFPRVSLRSVFSAIIALAISVSTGCRTDDPLYERYVFNDGKPVTCEGYELMVLANGRYIKKSQLPGLDYVCGDYASLFLGKPQEGASPSFVCTDFERKLAEEAMPNGLCPVEAPNCVDLIHHKEGQQDTVQKMCSHCVEGQISCNGRCVDLRNDPNNCGVCGNICDISKQMVCNNGVCSIIQCNEEIDTECVSEITGKRKCIDLANEDDDEHCGECNHACDKNTERCQDRKCVSKNCVDYCPKESVLESGMAESAYIELFHDVELVCIEPNDPKMCGIESCQEFLDAFKENRLGCKDELSCQQVDNGDSSLKYECGCPAGAFKNGTRCLRPLDDRSCGATEMDPGKVCTDETGHCNPEDMTCSLCQGGRVACTLDGQTVCVDPYYTDEFCGADHNCQGYKACDSQTSECINGLCVCKSGYAACGNTENGNSGGCLKLTDDEMMENHCGARSRGFCNDTNEDSHDYAGTSCKNKDSKGQCNVDNSGNTYCSCQGKENIDYIVCDGKCIYINNVEYCGAKKCDELGENCEDNIIANGSELQCVDGQCHCKTGTLVKDHPDFENSVCIDTLNDPKCCTNGNVCEGNNCLAQNDNFVCSNGQCVVQNCGKEQQYCHGRCLDNIKSDCNECDDGFCPVMGTDGESIVSCVEPETLGFCGQCGVSCTNNQMCMEKESGYVCACKDNIPVYYFKGKEFCSDRTPDNAWPPHIECDSDHQCKCLTGYDDLNNEFDDGCEIDLNSDVNHCGSRDNDCTKLPHVVSVYCEKGVCGGRCDNRFDNCDLKAGNDLIPGCEADLTTSKTCGSCDNVCDKEKICNTENYKCCYQSKAIYSHAMDKLECCDTKASVWRECSTGLCWFLFRDRWQCAESEPDGNWVEY